MTDKARKFLESDDSVEIAQLFKEMTWQEMEEAMQMLAEFNKLSNEIFKLIGQKIEP